MSRKLLVALFTVLACTGQSADRAEKPAAETSPSGPTAGSPAGRPATGAPAPALSVADQVRALDARLASLEVTQGSADMRGTMSRYRAYWEQGAVVLIEEEAALGNQGTRRARYYYDQGGSLIHYSEEPALTMDFDASGAMIAGAKTAGGAPAAIEPFEINAAQMRGRELRTAVTMGPGR